ncbi:MAG TPA: MFS transporter [Gaiellaceae bacterium]|nr:MFS transporter [Gaiellaceae bacterium]
MDARLAPGDRPTALSAFRSRDFRLLWGGQTISYVGDTAFLIALGWRVTSLTGSVGSLGFVLSLNAAAMLTTLLWGGVLADRHSRRLMMIGSDLARAGLVAVLAAVDGTGHLSMGSIMALAALIGFADGFFHPAFGGILPLVVDQPVLASANSMISIARQGSAILGPALAAALYGTAGPTTVWALDAASFVFSAALLWRARPRTLAAAPREGTLRELRAGFRYTMSVPWIWTGIAIATVILMIGLAPYNALLPRIVRSHFNRGVGSYGLLFSLMAVGMVVGSVLYAHWNPRRNRIILCYAAFGINDLGIVVVAVTHSFTLALAAVAWRGFWLGIAISLWTTLLTELVPGSFLSRVVSLDVFGSFALTPVGYAIVGAVAGLFSPAQIVAFGGAVGALLWFVPLSSREVRRAA